LEDLNLMKTMILLSVVALTLALPTLCLAGNGIVPVPEPASGLLLLLGGGGVAAYRKFKKSRP
jgi:hypothetical protein